MDVPETKDHMTHPSTPGAPQENQAEDVVARILARSGTALQTVADEGTSHDGDQLDRTERQALSRVAGLSTELEDVTEVEYRQLRLERVVLVGLATSGTMAEAEVSLRELAALAETAGSVVLDGLLQRRPHPDPATFLGSGKAAELRDVVASVGADTVVVDSELAPSQRRALEDVVKVKVVDRTALILDIFAQHAKSREGKAQVELAQLEYLLPRLRGWGESMSRQAGGRVAGGEGIGSRGPGETQIELDRRRIRTRMARLRRQLRDMAPARSTRRSSRRRNHTPAVAIAGYTNAGKSSLLNRIAGAGALVQNQLFATLDTTVRRASTPEGREYTLTDTVGFVRRLPTQLVEAFRSTLEEIAEADLLLHVVDAAHPDPVGQVEAVHAVLAEIEGASDVREIIVLNKSDLAGEAELMALHTRFPGAHAVSAYTGQGIEELAHAIGRELAEVAPIGETIELTVPFARGDLVARAHSDGEVLDERWTAEGTELRALVDPALAADLRAATGA
ncbi:GTPase HflX [Georgenia sp. Z1491]|uniref:GTPase HflX n=1 Tax=Georgenia sp. Z1491 TaxID=3416707 RepID=UPI003CE772FD